MTTARVIDTQRLSTLAHEHERELLQFLHDLTHDLSKDVAKDLSIDLAKDLPKDPTNHGRDIELIRREVVKVPFAEVRIDPMGKLLVRLGTGKHVVMMNAQGAAETAGMLYAARLIHELGMYDDFTLWVANSVQTLKEGGIHPDCLLLGEPTNLCIKMREGTTEGFLSESHPLVEAAIATYETLFELPPILSQSPWPGGPIGLPTIGFGPGEEQQGTPARHLLKAAQFYAAFPTVFVEMVTRR
jgi:hypothetical protein